MADNIIKRGNFYYYDFMLDNRRYRGSTKTDDKKLAQNIADTIKADILRKKHSLPKTINYKFEDVWDVYIKSQVVGLKTISRRKVAAKHFLPIFNGKNIANITQNDIENYQLKRKVEILSMPKNINKREQEINFRSVKY